MITFKDSYDEFTEYRTFVNKSLPLFPFQNGSKVCLTIFRE